MTIQAMVTIITDAGLAAAIDAQANGLKLELTHIAVGDGQVMPDVTATALTNERERVEIMSWSEVDPATLEVSGLLQSEDVYRIHEIGIFDANGTLVAIAFRALGIVEKSAGIAYPIQFNMPLVGLPADSVTVNASLNLDLAYLGPIAALTSNIAFVTMKQIDQEIRLRVREGRPTGGMEELVL